MEEKDNELTQPAAVTGTVQPVRQETTQQIEQRQTQRVPTWEEGYNATSFLQDPMWEHMENAQNPNYEYFKQFRDDPAYNSMDDPSVDAYPLDLFRDSGSAEETTYIQQQFDREREARITEQNMSTFQSLATNALVAGTNPIFYATGSLSAGTKLSTFLMKEALAEGVNEMALQFAQEERTDVETGANVAGALLMSGFIGGGQKMFTKAEIVKARESSGNLMEQSVASHYKPLPEKGSVGAALAREDIALDDAGAINTMSMGPKSRVMDSDIPEFRAVSEELVDSTAITERMRQGDTHGPSVESLKGALEGKAATALNASDEAYRLHKAETPDTSAVDFQQQIGRQLSYPSDMASPRVAQAARAHKRVYDGVLQWAKDVGRISENVYVKFAHGYMPRMYDRVKLLANKNYFIQGLTDHLFGGIKHGTLVKISHGKSDWVVPATSLDALKRDNPGLVVRSAPVNEAAMKIEAQEAAEKVFDDLVGHTSADFPVEGLVGPSGNMMQRTLGLSDAFLSPVLEKRADLVMKHWLRDMSFDMAMWNRFGEHDLTDTLAAGLVSAKKIVRDKGLTGKVEEKFWNKYNRDVKDILGMRDVLAGKYGAPETWTSAHTLNSMARTVTDTIALPGVTVSSLGDIAMIPMRHGFKPFMAGLARWATDHRNISKAAKIDMGIMIEKVFSGRQAALFGDITEHAQQGKGVKAANEASKILFRWNLLNHWTDVMQDIEVEVASDAFIKAMKKGTRQQRTQLARAGIGEDMYSRILTEVKESGGMDPRLWQDAQAAEVWGAALRSEMKMAVLEPGAGDIPLWARTEIGKSFFKYKSFQWAAHNRMLMSGLGNPAAHTMSGLMFLMATQWMIGGYKDWTRGKDNSDRAIFDSVYESAERSGTFGVFALPLNFGRELYFDKKASRYASAGLENIALGPVVGKAIQAKDIITDALDPNKEVKAKRVVGMIPYLNVHGLRAAGMTLAEDR